MQLGRILFGTQDFYVDLPWAGLNDSAFFIQIFKRRIV